MRELFPGYSKGKEDGLQEGKEQGHKEGLEEGKRTERDRLRGATLKKYENKIQDELWERHESSIKKSIREREINEIYLKGRRTGWDDVTAKIVELRQELGGTRRPQPGERSDR